MQLRVNIKSKYIIRMHWINYLLVMYDYFKPSVGETWDKNRVTCRGGQSRKEMLGHLLLPLGS